MINEGLRKIGTAIFYVSILVFVSVAFFWITSDYLTYYEGALEHDLKIWYYSSAPIIALLLSFLLAKFNTKLPSFLSYLMFVLVNIYVLFSFLQFIGSYCDEVQNLTAFYKTLNGLLLIGAGYFVVLKVLKKLDLMGKVIVAVSTLLAFVDFLYLLIGYEIFYPGFW